MYKCPALYIALYNVNIEIYFETVIFCIFYKIPIWVLQFPLNKSILKKGSMTAYNRI